MLLQLYCRAANVGVGVGVGLDGALLVDDFGVDFGAAELGPEHPARNSAAPSASATTTARDKDDRRVPAGSMVSRIEHAV